MSTPCQLHDDRIRGLEVGSARTEAMLSVIASGIARIEEKIDAINAEVADTREQVARQGEQIGAQKDDMESLRSEVQRRGFVIWAIAGFGVVIGLLGKEVVVPVATAVIKHVFGV